MSLLSISQKRWIIYGLGVTGMACARYFKSQSIPFVMIDSRENPIGKESFIKEFSVSSFFGEALGEFLFTENDVLLVSPGISLKDDVVTKAKEVGAVISSDVEYFSKHITKPVIAITGSNGKSTVTKLVEQMLLSANVNAVACGNIGLPVMDLLEEQNKYDVFVVELSSFQLERFDNLNAHAACILNVTEDHLDRYDSFVDYAQAKQAVFNGAKYAVINTSDSTSECRSQSFNGEKIFYGIKADDKKKMQLWLGDSSQKISIEDNDGLLLAANDVYIKGKHNLINAMAALCLALTVTDNKAALLEALKKFPGLSHRCQWVADVNDVQYFNDSKATNVGAAIAAIDGLKDAANKLYLIAGGQDKNSDFSELKIAVDQHVSKVFLFGQDAKKIHQCLGLGKSELVSDLHQAVIKARNNATAGDVVLFSPACASFDMYKNYEERGDAFVVEVQGLAA